MLPYRTKILVGATLCALTACKKTPNPSLPEEPEPKPFDPSLN